MAKSAIPRLALELLDEPGMLTRLALVSSLLLSSSLLAACVDERPASQPGQPGEPDPVTVDWAAVPHAGALVADARALYASTGDSLVRIPLDGSATQTLVTLPAATDIDLRGITSLVVGDTDVVYVTSVQDFDTLATTRTLSAIAKTGGTPRELASSQDSRAYLGMTIDGPDVVYSSFTSLARIPLAGGPGTYIGESPCCVHYWAFSPTIVGDSLFWAESATVFEIAKTARGERGTPFATIPGQGTIIASDNGFVVAIGESYGYPGNPTGFVTIDASGTTSALVPFAEEAWAVDASDDAVWAATMNGLLRVARDGSSSERLTTDFAQSVVVTDEAVFTGGETGITRIAR